MKRFVLILAMSISLLGATEGPLNLKRQQFSVGPEYEYLKRSKKGGTHQSGDLYGVQFNYGRLKRYGWYIGAMGSWSKGTIDGHASTIRLRSTYTDQFIEGRLGYTFQQKDGAQASFTPYVGGGYLEEKNNFSSKYTLPLHTKTNFGYATTGFLFWLNLSPSWDIGLNFSARLPYEPKCRISNDPDFESVKQTIGERVQYRGELPICWSPFCQQRYSFIFRPFYEIRNYPSRPNFPFDYYKNNLKFSGATLELQIRV